jgi:hypothetical protein
MNLNFTNGKHLANYILKIFKNNEIAIPENQIDSIRELSKIFTYIENLPIEVKDNLDLSNEYYNWIILAQGGKCQELATISKNGNANIAKFLNNSSIISFDEVFGHIYYFYILDSYYLPILSFSNDSLPISKHFCSYTKRLIYLLKNPSSNNLVTVEVMSVLIVLLLELNLIF